MKGTPELALTWRWIFGTSVASSRSCVAQARSCRVPCDRKPSTGDVTTLMNARAGEATGRDVAMRDPDPLPVPSADDPGAARRGSSLKVRIQNRSLSVHNLKRLLVARVGATVDNVEGLLKEERRCNNERTRFKSGRRRALGRRRPSTELEVHRGRLRRAHGQPVRESAATEDDLAGARRTLWPRTIWM
jgi:hypothetical protein